LVAFCLVGALLAAVAPTFAFDDAVKEIADLEPSEGVEHGALLGAGSPQMDKLKLLHKKSKIMSKIRALTTIKAAKKLVGSAQDHAAAATDALTAAEAALKEEETNHVSTELAMQTSLKEYGLTKGNVMDALSANANGAKIVSIITQLQPNDDAMEAGKEIDNVMELLANPPLSDDDLEQITGMLQQKVQLAREAEQAKLAADAESKGASKTIAEHIVASDGQLSLTVQEVKVLVQQEAGTLRSEYLVRQDRMYKTQLEEEVQSAKGALLRSQGMLASARQNAADTSKPDESMSPVWEAYSNGRPDTGR